MTTESEIPVNSYVRWTSAKGPVRHGRVIDIPTEGLLDIRMIDGPFMGGKLTVRGMDVEKVERKDIP